MANLPESPNSHAFVHRSCSNKIGSMKTPQQLSREAIEDFRAIYEEEFGKHLSDDEVQEIALRLLRFFGILNRPASDNASDQDTICQ
jgi:hypothetical protein